MSAFSLAPLGGIAVATAAGASLLTRREPSPVERLAQQQLSGADASEMFALTVALLLGLFYLTKTYWASILPLVLRLAYMGGLGMMLVHLLRPLLIRISERHLEIPVPSLAWVARKLCGRGRKGGEQNSQGTQSTLSAPGTDRVTVFFVDLIGLALAAPVCALYWFWDNWVLYNCLALVAAVYMIDTIRIPSARTGVLLLLAYFAYDVYFVFFSAAMVSVAKAIDIPAKLLWPRAPGEFSLSAPSRPGDRFSMLGLGDIVIPGLFLALLARLDRRFPDRVPLFWPAMLAYALAVAAAMGVLVFTQHAQPVLFYIVPFVTVTFFACLALRGRGAFRKVLGYTEPSGDEPAEGESEDTSRGNAACEGDAAQAAKHGVAEPASE